MGVDDTVTEGCAVAEGDAVGVGATQVSCGGWPAVTLAVKPKAALHEH